MAFTYEHHAKYYETDQMGIIHHSNYIRWMEESRIALMDYAGISYRKMEEMKVISPVLSIDCQYKSMTHFDDVVVITPKVIKYNGVKLEIEYEMRDKESNELRVVGHSGHCFLDDNRKPVSLKRSFPEIHEKFMKLTDLQ